MAEDGGGGENNADGSNDECFEFHDELSVICFDEPFGSRNLFLSRCGVVVTNKVIYFWAGIHPSTSMR